MRAVNRDRSSTELLQPWQVFDMIGGTSTGGYALRSSVVVTTAYLYSIIAVMLGRLYMTLEDCETTYLTLFASIFNPRRRKFNLPGKSSDFLLANGKFDTEKFEEQLKKEVKQVHEKLRALESENPADSEQEIGELLLKENQPECKVLVFARCLNCPCAS